MFAPCVGGPQELLECRVAVKSCTCFLIAASNVVGAVGLCIVHGCVRHTFAMRFLGQQHVTGGGWPMPCGEVSDFVVETCAEHVRGHRFVEFPSRALINFDFLQ